MRKTEFWILIASADVASLRPILNDCLIDIIKQAFAAVGAPSYLEINWEAPLSRPR